MSLGPAEILVILVIALLVFGPHKLPDVGRQVGRTMREFRKFQETMRRDLGDVFGDDASYGSDPPPTLPPKDEAADESSVAGEPGTDAPPDAAATD